MNLWDKVEMFIWDGRLSLRDVKTKKTLFYIDMDGREYWAVKKLQEQIVPKIVELMNSDIFNNRRIMHEYYSVAFEDSIKRADGMASGGKNESVVDASKPNGNGSNLIDPAIDKPKRRGRPFGWRKK